jgi:hypothetical protein
MKHAGLAAFALSLAACATAPMSGPAPAAHPIPATPIDFGDWRHASAAATLRQFQSAVEARYPSGVAIAAAVADLRRTSFNCGGAGDRGGRGNPPAQICRRTVTAGDCTGTWQVHLFGDDGRLAHARALFDRRCGGDGLLGGPG